MAIGQTVRARSVVAMGPTSGGIVAAAVFWAVAITLSLLTAPISNQPGGVWTLRVIVTVGGTLLAVGLILREKYRAGHGLPPDSDATAFDLWTIAHTMAGVVMGSWGIPLPLVVVFTICWEIFEYTVPGFGDGEIFMNRVVDIAVAWGGWLIFAGLISLTTNNALPLLLPDVQSLLRNGGLHLFSVGAAS